MSTKPQHKPLGDPCERILPDGSVCGDRAAHHRLRDQTGRRGGTRGPNARVWSRQIIAIDGEGRGRDDLGRQDYLTMSAADENGAIGRLFTGKRLSTWECLEFLYSLPREKTGPHLTSYSFGYDTAQILRDLPYEVQMAIHAQSHDDDEDERKPPVRYRGWAFSLTPGKLLYIKRQGSDRGIRVWDAFPFHQKSYIRLLGDFAECRSDEDMQIISEGKKRRPEDVETLPFDPELELGYSETECRTLARIQRKVYEAQEALGYPLSDYYGAGSCARAMLKKEGVKDLLPECPEDMAQAVDLSYVGGRFETSGMGVQPVLWEADIHSAYPAAARDLPCMAEGHGQWIAWDGHGAERALPNLKGRIGIYHVRWEPDGSVLPVWGPFCMRMDRGMPAWPYSGHAWVWNEELWSGMKLPGFRVKIERGWWWRQDCDHGHPLGFLQDTYDSRARHKAEGNPIEKIEKLGPNALYGSFACNVGAKTYRSVIWASLLTSMTRAKLLRAIAPDPAAVVMTATDAVYATRRLPHVPISDRLGDWEDGGLHGDVLIVQPGLYQPRWSEVDQQRKAGKMKTRGISASKVPWEEVRRAWDDGWRHGATPVEVPVSINRFVGLGLARIYNRDGMMGRWEDVMRSVGFRSDKRPYAPLALAEARWRPTMAWKPSDPQGWEIERFTRHMLRADPKVRETNAMREDAKDRGGYQAEEFREDDEEPLDGA